MKFNVEIAPKILQCWIDVALGLVKVQLGLIWTLNSLRFLAASKRLFSASVVGVSGGILTFLPSLSMATIVK